MRFTDANPATGDRGDRQQEEHFWRNVAELNNRRATARQVPSGPPDSPLIPKSGKSATAHLSGPTGGEESDTYPRVVAKLNDRWRVITCKSSIQWILQRRRGGADHWRGYWFCRTKEALIRGARHYAGEIHGDALAVLLRLPERIGGES
jgi:hypothetical protein